MLKVVGGERGVYTRGEEVVVLLDGVEVLDFGRARMVDTAALPAWSIGTVGAVVRRDGALRYAVFFREGLRECVCIVGEEAIEGVA